jgi:hypothetical protein
MNVANDALVFGFILLAISWFVVALMWLHWRGVYCRKVARLGEYDSSTRFYVIDVGALCGGRATKPCAVFDESTGRVHVYTTRLSSRWLRKELGRE